MATPPAVPPLLAYARRTRETSVNLFFLMPFLLVYLLCRALAGPSVENEAAASLRDLLRLLGPRALRTLTLCAALGLCALVLLRLRRRGSDVGLFPGMLAEGAVLGLLLGTLAHGLAGLLPVGRWAGIHHAAFGAAGAGADVVRRLGIAVGAGIFEELVFRGLLCLALYRALRDVVGIDRWTAGGAAAALSALVFAAYHHWGVGAEPWDAATFTFRFHAGVLLGLVFLTRGIGIAALAHGVYDALVLLRA